MEERTEKFLDLYKELEFYGRNTYFPKAPDNENIIGRLITLPQLAKYRDELNYIRVVRNFLTHNPKVGGGYPVEPSTEMLVLLDKIVDIIKVPVKALEICTRRKDMLTVNTGDNLFDVITKMRTKNYTHAPVFHKNKFLGILSEATVVSYMLHFREISVDAETTVDFLSSVVDFKHEANNSRLIFISEETTFDEIKATFEENYKKGMPFSAAFITKNGKWNEVIMGMITPYDLLEHLSG